MAKKYYEYMQEIDSSELYKRLIEFGFFSEKLPPILDSSDFLNFCLNKANCLPGKPSRWIEYNSMRNTNVPRIINIPTPASYEKLCRTLSDNWNNIVEHFRKYTSSDDYKKSRIHIRKHRNTPSLFKMNYGSTESILQKLELSIGKKYLVKADISQCYASIYTHSIPWALVGKEIAKQKQNDNEWYNTIDKTARNTMNRETHGIPIGPHTSNILSEIVLCAVDKELSEYSYIRDIDDYECYVESEEVGKQFLLHLSNSLNKYGLRINHKKTTIEKQPHAEAYHWTVDINEKVQILNSNSSINGKNMQHFLHSCIQIMHNNDDNASIVLYGIKSIDPKKLSDRAIQVLIMESTSLAITNPYLMQTIEEYVYSKYLIECIFDLPIYLNKMYKQFIIEECYDALSYTIQIATKYKIRLNSFDVEKIINSKDCILLLCTLIYCRHFKLNNEIDQLKEYAKKLNSNKDSREENWLFIYECLDVELDEYWKTLKKNNVSFLKSEYR